MWRRGDYMKWEEIYQSLSIQERMIVDVAEAYRVDLTKLANLQVQKQENVTHVMEELYGRD
ncbi:hypothetical protein [Gilliamella sp. W8128]|uniref:hypothetical protein n=1 Tax=Gilliamella sp. W8128 TaxID=2751010 RepID=UPI0018DD23E6|nr:hypothetical protein [Gilliamella sp. W8128]MBI0154149.1 hypothetical protein [Gilliamella sp. W8128]